MTPHGMEVKARFSYQPRFKEENHISRLYYRMFYCNDSTYKFMSLDCVGTFKLTLQCSEDYPNKPPVVRFVSRMFHPNSKLDR